MAPEKSLSLIVDAELPEYTIASVTLDDAGEYVCIVSDISGSAQSDSFTLVVTDTALPVTGLLGLALAAALTALAGATALRRKD